MDKKIVLIFSGSAPTPRVMMKSAKLEWSLDDLDAALKLLDEALKVFPDFAKLWMMIGQIHEQRGDMSKAFDAYNSGVNLHYFFYIAEYYSLYCFFLDQEMPQFDSLVVATVKTRRKTWAVNKSPFGARKSEAEESQKRPPVAGSHPNRNQSRYEGHRQRHDGKSSSRVFYIRYFMGRVHFHGT